MSTKTQGINSFFFSRWLFLRLLGCVFLITFLSTWIQVDGLMGSEGIMPAHTLLELVYDKYGIRSFSMLPTWFWINASDLALHVVCGLGVIGSVLLILGWFEAVVIFILWSLYLSIVSVGRDFYSFQWDIFLLEVSFLSIFLASWRIKSKSLKEDPPSVVIVGLLYWVVFRIVFESGMVKLTSGDISWRNMTALTYHFFTQPLPNGLSWGVHQWPEWWLRLLTFMMFVIELALPFLIFLGRMPRLIAAGGITLLMVLISITGNYAYFNLLTVIICILFLDDNMWRHIMPSSWMSKLSWSGAGKKKDENLIVKNFCIGILTVMVVILSTTQLLRITLNVKSVMKPFRYITDLSRPFHFVNSYGLFATMTKERPEIIIEGSYDGQEWYAYEFPWKPGDLKRKPSQVAPHQPRLDWQMWFAALGGNYKSNQWFIPLMKRLLEGSESVTNLLINNPFEDKPPTHVRALIYKYEFTTSEERRKTGQWWKRHSVALYCPPVSLKPESEK
ncbi:MAG: hypothetical protein ACI9E5_000099 [Candidatus Omnitrophota bacterium]|jgi:hypothetical protein